MTERPRNRGPYKRWLSEAADADVPRTTRWRMKRLHYDGEYQEEHHEIHEECLNENCHPQPVGEDNSSDDEHLEENHEFLYWGDPDQNIDCNQDENEEVCVQLNQ